MEKSREALERLQKGVEEVFDSENYKKYLGTMSKFYNYSFGNCMLIYMQKPGASYVAGYNAWKTKFHRTVKKGEKGIQILAPCTGKRTATVEVDGSMEEREQAYTYFRVAYVFDISQTEGEELPSIVSKLTDSVDGYGSLIGRLISASAVVSNRLLEEWGVDKETAFNEGWKNESPKVKKLKEMFSEMIGMEIPDDGTNCYIVTNDRKFNGAASIFKPEVADALCELLDDDLVIAPTSIHEVMVHPKRMVPVDQLKEILTSTVDEATPENDFLTKSVYEYDRETKQFRIAA